MSPSKKPPTKAALRAAMLERIRTAHFPKDAEKFTLHALQQTGFCEKYPKKDGLTESSYKVLVLLATQADVFRKERDWLKTELENSKPYYSPLLSKVDETVDPLEQAKLRKEVEADEQRERLERAARQQTKEAEWAQIVTAFSKKSWNSRDRRTKPHRAYVWHGPMSWKDYHIATGLSRRTIQNILKRLQAVPLRKPVRENQPLQYGADVNLTVLAAWLLEYVKNVGHRRAWLARTLLIYRHDAPDKFESVVEALWSIFESLGINTVDRISEFREYLNQCDAELYPPPPPQFSDGHGISAILNQHLLSVGKSG